MSAAKYNAQLAAWAVDRAIEVSKQNPSGERDIATITKYAEGILTWIASITPDVEEPELSDAEKAELEEHAKHLRGEGIPLAKTETVGEA